MVKTQQAHKRAAEKSQLDILCLLWGDTTNRWAYLTSAPLCSFLSPCAMNIIMKLKGALLHKMMDSAEDECCNGCPLFSFMETSHLSLAKINTLKIHRGSLRLW